MVRANRQRNLKVASGGETYVKIADRNVLITVMLLADRCGPCNTGPKPLVPFADRILMTESPHRRPGSQIRLP